jgi:hypothetical protein
MVTDLSVFLLSILRLNADTSLLRALAKIVRSPWGVYLKVDEFIVHKYKPGSKLFIV